MVSRNPGNFPIGGQNIRAIRETSLKAGDLGLKVVLLVTLLVSAGKLKSANSTSAIPSVPVGSSSGRIVHDSGALVIDGEVLVKFQAQQAIAKGAALTGLAALDALFNRMGVTSLEQAYPPPALRFSAEGRELQKIYIVRYAEGESPRRVAAEISGNPDVEYAVPRYVHRISDMPSGQIAGLEEAFAAVPDDPQYVQMSHLPRVQAPPAWDIVKGEDGEVIVAIVDGGTDWQHEDLEANVWSNPLEVPDNYLDDDGNGYVDDIHGWNFASNSGDPGILESAPVNGRHGTAVAGIAAAVTNNAIGIAGAGWNARYMPVNTTCESDSLICYGYDGITYAAANGADIINASWGSTITDLTLSEQRRFLAYIDDIIDYAVSEGALVISSAGNDNVNNDHALSLPAGAAHVLAAGATGKSDDRKAGFSNYGVSVDVFAPGIFLNTTYPEDSYTSELTGTSFSSPLVAGIAALVKTRFPGLSPDQVAQQLRVTADPIDDVNPNLSGLMGKGRINAYRAVTDTTLPAIRITEVSFQDEGLDGAIDNGETVDVTVRLKNYLTDAAGVSATLIHGATQDVTITDAEDNLPALLSGAADDVQFQFTTGLLGQEHPIYFTVIINADGYQDRDVFRLYANEPPYLTHDTGPLRVSITTEGNIGWTGYKDESSGEGFVYLGSSMLFEGGLLVATSSRTVSDCVRGVGEELENDFSMPPGEMMTIVPGEVANEEGRVMLTDDPAPSPIGITIQQDSYAHNDENYDDFVIFRYTITNTSGGSLSNLYAGLFFDWDIRDDAADYARFDASRQMGIVQNSSSNPTQLAATRLLTRYAELSFHAINNPIEIYGGDAGNGFIAAEKWQFLSNGVQRTRLDNVDVSTLTASGPYTIQPGGIVELAFAVIGATNLNALNAHADSAQVFWDSTIVAVQPNHAPTFTSVLPTTTITSVESIHFTYTALDVDGDTLSFGLSNPPANATIDAETGQFVFQPDIDQVGTFDITTYVSDGTYSSTAITEVTVTEVATLLEQNYANPFSASQEGETRIRYQITAPGRVTLVVYDLLGREVRTLVDAQKEAGQHTEIWYATDNQGRRVSAGIYFYRIEAGDFIVTRKLVVLK